MKAQTNIRRKDSARIEVAPPTGPDWKAEIKQQYSTCIFETSPVRSDWNFIEPQERCGNRGDVAQQEGGLAA